MARIRTIKPEFWQDEKMAPLPALPRLVFLGLICMADDAGRIVDNVKLIDGVLFSETRDTARDALDTLARLSRVLRYTSASGQKLIQIINWSKHQKVDHAAKYTLPAPTAEDYAAQGLTPDGATLSRDVREDRARVSRSDLLPTTYDQLPTPDDGAGAPDGLDADAKKKSLADAVKRVSTHYTTTHPRRKITPELKKLIARRLDRHTAEELIEAIDGNATDPWHVEKSKHELSYVLRNSEHVEMFVEKARAFAAAQASQVGTEHGADTSTRRADALYRLFVQHGFSQPLPIEQHDAKIDALAAEGALKQPERIKLELRAVAPWGWFRSVRPGFERQAIERIARDIATVPRTNGAASAPAGGA